MTAVISMWSGPRNISTTMMRSFGNRPDVVAIDEPFYACYLVASGADHPYRKETLSVYPSTPEGVINWIKGKSAVAPILFLKHIAYHLPDDADFSLIDNWRNFLLIRDPRAMVASFSSKFDDVKPIARSYVIERRIFDRLTAQGISCPIVDAADVQRAPQPMLSKLCAALGIPYDPAMLAWPSGPRPEDGPWAPHWYDAVRASTGFRPHVEKPVPLTEKLEKVAKAAEADYRYLSDQRLLP